MKKFISRYGKMTLVALFGLCIFLFWYCGYPQALCYQEQNQLFLWSADYFWHDLSVAGGLADYISDIGGKTKCVKMNETLNQWKAL